MNQIAEYNQFDKTDQLGINLLQLVYEMSDIICELKEAYCQDEPINHYYGDNFRDTIIPAYCGCHRQECGINALVDKYKRKVAEFGRLWPRMGYTMLL